MKQLEFSVKETSKLPDGSTLLTKNMSDIMHDSMMPYAEYVIMDRAIPRVEDGLKPVQRRILYSMHELGLKPDRPYRKSAAVVGDCLAKYHPHGDTSVYDAMVRLAQKFNMRMPLVDGQGNFGSMDGDSAAAMRYTEARLTPLALEMLRDLDMDTVRWCWNYDDKLQEPEMLPSRFPNILVNGSSGIAVGLATNIPPHNLGEVIDGVVAYIDKKNISLKEMMKIVRGPDFPTGGYVIADELEQAYETGKGKITMRAKVHIEVLPNDRKNLVITELPYQVNKADLLTKILALREDKKDLLAGIAEIVDESDKEGVRAVVRIKKDYDPKKILDILFKHTNLQCTYGINMVAIADGKPQQMGLLDIIACYTNYQRDVVYNRTKFQLKKAKERAHILEGLIIAIKNIDEVVAIIKKSQSTSEARQNLRSRFNLTEVQADAILELKLARLTKLEITKLVEELEDLNRQIEEFQRLINSKQALMEQVKSELLAIKKQYRDARRTVIVNKIEDVRVPSESDEKAVESFVVGLTADGMIKCIPAKNFALSAKDANDKLTQANLHTELFTALSTSKVMFFSDRGNCYQTTADKLTETKFRENGMPLKKYFRDCEEGEKPVKVFVLGEALPKGKLLFYTAQGLVKLTDWSEYELLKSAFQAIKLKADYALVKVETLEKDSTVLYVTKGGLCLNFSPDEIPEQGRVAGGVKGMMIADDDSLVFAGQIHSEGEVVVVTDKCFSKRVLAVDIDLMTRYRKGVKICDINGLNGNGVFWAGYVTKPFDILFMDAAGMLLLNTEDINIENRTTKGKPPKLRKKGMALTFATRFVTAAAMGEDADAGK